MTCQPAPGAFFFFAYHATVMKAGVIVKALSRERAALAVRWLEQFSVSRAADGHDPVDLDETLVLAMLDDLIAELDPAMILTRARTADHADAFAALADFPDNLAVAIDLLQAGVQVLGAFAVENAGPWAAWSVRERNRFLGELDAIFPVLVRREVAALCERYLPAAPQGARLSSGEMFSLPQWARAIARRN